jgi:hypothetical protein
VIEVAHRLVSVRAAAALRAQRHHRAMNRRSQMLIEQSRRANDNAGADHVEHALECERADQNDRERDQRRHAAARQDPIVDLQHVERSGQHQQIDHGGEQRNAPKRAAAILQGRRDVRMCGLLISRQQSNHQLALRKVKTNIEWIIIASNPARPNR